MSHQSFVPKMSARVGERAVPMLQNTIARKMAVFLQQKFQFKISQCVNSARHLYVFQFSEFDFWNSFIVFLWSYM